MASLICGRAATLSILNALRQPSPSAVHPTSTSYRHIGYGHGNGHNNGNECYGRTLDDLPVPKGCWYAHHARRQKIYNMWLIAGVCYLGASLAMALQAFDFHPYPEQVIQLKPEDFHC